MPLHLVRSGSNAALWSTCAGRFLDELGAHRGPGAYPTFLWLAHRSQRDSLFRLAARRGLPGWLAPPVSFLSELRDLFGIEASPVGLLTGRLLVARIAARTERRVGLRTGLRDRGPAQAHMLDRLFSELLPEGVEPETLREALEALEGDDFARRRNAWVADAYGAFLEELRRRDRYDPRSIHAMVAEKIEDGALAQALRGARRLHIYGITSLRGRRRLCRALASQKEVEVHVYLPAEAEPSEWEELAAGPAELVGPERPPAEPRVQPAPDALREAGWVAREVKRLLADGKAEPHEVAVVARTGERDTRLIHDALQAVGVPATARIRTPLAEIPALRALLALFRAEAEGWPYRALRQVLASPYLGVGVDVRAVDYLAGTRRIEGLRAWLEALERLRSLLEADGRWRLRREGVYRDRLEEDLPRLEAFGATAARLRDRRPETAWIDLTLEILSGAWLGFRRLLCRPAGERWDIVRLDQRGVLAVEGLLREWRGLVDSDEEFGPEEWHARLRRLFEANELALSTPLQAGVQVVEAHEAALTPYRHTFVVHANDGVFPRAPAGGGIFSDAERSSLRDRGLPFSDREEALRRERTLWRAVAGAGTVTITYRTTDANGVPRLPSLMVPPHDPAAEIPRVRPAGDRTEGETPDAPPPVSESEHRRREVLRLALVRRSGSREPFRTPDPASLRHAALAAFAEELRSGGLDAFEASRAELAASGVPEGRVPSAFAIARPLSQRPHPWNGRLRDPAVLARLEERFGDGYVWSASQLQQYGIRPFDFLLERVLDLGEVEEAEEETTPLAFGSVAHSLLERFYREAKDSLPPALDAATEALYEEVAEEVFRTYEADADQWLGLPPLWAVKKEEVREAVREFLRAELPYLARTGESPVLLEWQFGGADEPAVSIEGRDLQGRPAALLLRGRIDRVDRKGDGGRLRVVDYKSGQTPSPQGYRDGSLLQTALYMRAVQLTELGEVECGVFRSIKGRRFNSAELKRSGLEEVLRFALSIPGRVRAGLLEAAQARAVPLADWQPGREITRTEARIEAGTRFDDVAGPEPAGDGKERAGGGKEPEDAGA